MEKSAGVPLFQVWGNMTKFDQLQLIQNLTQIETQLTAIHFPAYRGLYLRKNIEQPIKSLDNELDPSFCIGPSCDQYYKLVLIQVWTSIKKPCESPAYTRVRNWLP